MFLKINIFLIFLLRYCNANPDKSICPSSDGNSSQICHLKLEACCDNECLKINETCPGFADDKKLAVAVFALSTLTDVGQVVIAIWYRKVFFYRLTWGEASEGFCYRSFLKYFEQLIHLLTFGLIGRWKLRDRRLEDVINTDKLSLWLSMLFSLGINFLQRILDLPYLDMSKAISIFSGDTCNYISSRQLTKPTEFYILFLLAEFYGLWAFWYCVYKLKGDIEKSGMELDKIKADCFDLECVGMCKLKSSPLTISLPESGKDEKNESEKL